ncbi:MAG: S53 family peptidase, partial [Acidimicrobiales bacterium]
RRHLSREELEALRGADPADLDVVAAFARGHGLELTEVDGGRRAVSLAGTAAAVGEAFGVGLARFEHPDGSYRGHSGPVRLPADMVAVTVAVLGLDDRPQARSHLRPAVGPSKSYTPVELGGLYGLPGGAGQTAGEGETIGIIELGGGYRADDLTTYFHGLGLAVPALTAVPVDGGANSPTGSSGGPDAEVVLDIEVAGALAPGAAIVVYFAPNTDRGFLDAVSTALHDRARSPSVVSISWGGPESSWTASAMRAFDQTLSDAALVGVTVTVAAGDGGSSDGVADGLAHVDFPASSPHALACGGTRLTVSGGAIEAEVVWNDGPGQGATGGGVSDVFGPPAWQQGAGVPPSANPGHRVGRGVPDVAGDADPATGYRVRVDGADIVVGGTSAVAPLWAGLVALLNQSLGHSVGYLNPLLYSSLGAGGGCRDIIAGGNGAYSAGPGWDACTGWGSPDGPRLESGLGAAGGG